MRERHPASSEGRPFTAGLDEVIVGERAADRFGLTVGSVVKIQKRDWKIVGVFASEGSGFESEIWGDLDVMAGPLRREGGYQVVVVRLADPSTLEAFKKTLEDDPQLQVDGDPGAELLRGAGRAVATRSHGPRRLRRRGHGHRARCSGP